MRNGYLPERELQTGVGAVPVRIPKVRDKQGKRGSKVKFNSRLVPPYLRKTMSVENLLPWLYLKGLSTGDFKEALASLLGPNAKGLSAPTISRLKAQWTAEHESWTKRSLTRKRYVYWWADGTHFNIRGDDARSCILVVIGVTETGHKEFVAIEEGLRESEQSWLEVLNNIKASGLTIGPELAIGDGALGFWKALTKVFGETRHQRCWVHKTANPIESTFATVRLRTAKTRGCVSRKSILAMVYKLGMSAQTRWRKLKGFNRLADVIRGVKFQDGVQLDAEQNTEEKASVDVA